MNRFALQLMLTMNVAIFGATGCVHSEKTTPAIDSEEMHAQQEYDPELDLNFGEEPWQREISTDIGQVEDAAESFIQSASDLYDLLIEANNDLIQRRMHQIDASIKLSTTHHALLVSAIGRLIQRMEQDDVRVALGKIPQGSIEYREVRDALGRFRSRDGNATSYREIQGRLLSGVPFGDAGSEDAALANMEPAQRDALALLDYLRFTSNTLASVSGAITQWVIQTNPNKHPKGLTLESLSH